MLKRPSRPEDLKHIPKGYKTYVTNCGIKDDSLDLGVVFSESEANAAAIFTQNALVGEPIKIGRQHIQGGRLQAIVVNSKNANVATGKDGYESSMQICDKLAAELQIQSGLVLPSSTGVIGRPLPAGKIIEALSGLSKNLEPADFQLFAEAIMTTDTHPKWVSARIGDATLLGVAKGSGMIEPNMATMLAYFFTDADLSPQFLKGALQEAADVSFNNLSVDSDTSTSDTLAIMANGLAGEVDEAVFAQTLKYLSIALTRMLARDGEGATKLFIVDIVGARDEAQARAVGKSIINSPLVKTMIYQGDPNWGRIVMAVGKTAGIGDLNLERDDLKIYWGKKREIPVTAPIEELQKYLTENEELRLTVDLGVGDSKGRFYGCDLTEEYVRINAYYTT